MKLTKLFAGLAALCALLACPLVMNSCSGGGGSGDVIPVSRPQVIQLNGSYGGGDYFKLNWAKSYTDVITNALNSAGFSACKTYSFTPGTTADHAYDDENQDMSAGGFTYTAAADGDPSARDLTLYYYFTFDPDTRWLVNDEWHYEYAWKTRTIRFSFRSPGTAKVKYDSAGIYEVGTPVELM